MIWIGVDPGPRTTGIAARVGQRLLGHAIIDRREVEPGTERPGYPTLDAIVAAITALSSGQEFRVAIEDVVQPNAFHDGGQSILNVTDLLRTAEIIGYVEHAFPGVVRVRPGKNGSHALATYPAELVTPGERRYAITRRKLIEPAPQNTHLRHVRSAYDVAGAGPITERLAEARSRQAAKNVPEPVKKPAKPRRAMRRSAAT